MLRKVLLISVILVMLTPVLYAAETKGYLSVRSADGVEILVDGKLAGEVKNGQLFLELAVGTYEITAQEYGFTPETIKNVKIEPFKATTLEISLKECKVISGQLSEKLQIDLIRKYGTVRVFSIPFNGAQVTINGEVYGETDIELRYFLVGQLNIEVGGPDKSKLTGSFFLEENSVLTLLADFIDKKIYQVYEVSFDFPTGVEMMIDNTMIERNRPSILLGETHSVELIARNSLIFVETTKREIVISKSGYYYMEPDNKPVQKAMVLVEQDSFTMGDTWGDGFYNENPTHKVELTYDFYVGKYPVTFEEYDRYCKETGATKPDDVGWGRGRRPAIMVSWFDAIAYCDWLSDIEGLPRAYDNAGNLIDSRGNKTIDTSKVKGYRLLTEAEWEYAARGGKKSRRNMYAGSNNPDEVAWYWQNSGDKHLTGKRDKRRIHKNNCRTQQVGTKVPNELGLYDMSGNVYEWCSDWYGDYSSSTQTNPYNSTASTEGSLRVNRGGSWSSVATYTRVADRRFSSPANTYYYLGFRICRTVF